MSKAQTRARKLKVYHWQGHRNTAPNGGQTREVVACYGKREARDLLDRRFPLSEIHESSSHDYIAVAMTKPGTIFWRPLDQIGITSGWIAVDGAQVATPKPKVDAPKPKRKEEAKSPWALQHEAYLAEQLKDRNAGIEASKFTISDQIGPLAPSIEGTVLHVKLMAPDGSTVEIRWDPYTRAFLIRAIEVAPDVTASCIEVIPHACNSVSVRARQGTEFIRDPIADKLAAGALHRARRRGAE